MANVIIANILNFIAGICSILSVGEKTKKKIVRIEFLGSIIRIISNSFVGNWSDVLAKVIKCCSQNMYLKASFSKIKFFLISLLYLILCLSVTYVSKDLRCLFAIVPSILEFYSLLVRSTRKYRLYIIITKMLWTINNIIFKLYVGIIFDLVIILGHYFKIKKNNKLM